MKAIKIIFVLFILVFSGAFISEVSAQCSLCTMNAENSVQNGNSEGKGLNDGIIYLLATPYLAIAGIGLLWYKKYRRKDVPIHIKDKGINLN
jgi:hypothetical protein